MPDTGNMQLLKEGRERNWYLVQEWVTRAGLRARIQYCVWNGSVRELAPSLHSFYTGYVLKAPADKKAYSEDNGIWVHGGVTHEGELTDLEGDWVGFDMAHAGDEDKQDLDYAVEQCENLASQMESPNYSLTPEEKQKIFNGMCLSAFLLIVIYITASLFSL